MIERCVYIRTSFAAYHRWVLAPREVAFLINFHRHIFHVKIGVEVSNKDREVEFFLFKKQVDEYIDRVFKDEYLEHSCEEMAEMLLTEFDASFVEVNEDNENGALVSRSE